MFRNIKKLFPVAFFVMAPIAILVPFAIVIIQRVNVITAVFGVQMFAETVILSILFLSYHRSFAYNPRSSSFFIPMLVVCEQIIIFLSIDRLCVKPFIDLNISAPVYISCYIFGVLMIIGYGLFYQMNDSKIVYRYCILSFIASIAVAAYRPFTITTSGIVIDPVVTILYYVLVAGAIVQYFALAFTDPPGSLVKRDTVMIFFIVSIGMGFIDNMYTGILSSAVNTAVSLCTIFAIRMNWFTL